MIKIPQEVSQVAIARQGDGDRGWSIFYIDKRGDHCELYGGCTLDEAAAVQTEYWETGDLSRATMPKHLGG